MVGGFSMQPILSLGWRATIGFKGRLAGRHDPARDPRSRKMVLLLAYLGKYPEQLSGGQQQRVGSRGRWRTAGPVLATKPIGNLDGRRGDRDGLMRDLATETGAALLVVTHSSGWRPTMGRRLHTWHGA